jgi:iron(III) transport system permease protein
VSGTTSFPIRSGWFLVSLLIALGCAIPLGYLGVRGFLSPVDLENWRHLSEYVLPRAWMNTLLLSLSSVIGASILGVGFAALLVHFEFPGRKAMQGLLVLPLSLPGYVIGFTWLGILDYNGPVQGFMRMLGFDALSFQVRGLPLLVMVFSVSLYPYVYLLAKSAFESLDPRMPEAARTLGGSSARMRLRLSVPWIFGGASLVFMETIADYGTVMVFNFDTLSVAILKAWKGLFSFESAARISAVLAFFVVLIVLGLESPLRRRLVGSRSLCEPPARVRLSGVRALASSALCCAVFGLGFAVPLAQLFVWAIQTESSGAWQRVAPFVVRSFGVGALVAGFGLGLSLFLAMSVRFAPSVLVRVNARIATLGYAIPGVVLAVAIHAVTYVASRSLGAWLAQVGVLWVAALLVRFNNVGYQPIRRGYERISERLDEASVVLGAGQLRTVCRIHAPLLWRAFGVSTLLVFVDVLKEVPITLMMRPTGYETLAVRVVQFTSEGLWAEAAFPSLLIGAVGIVPALLLARGERV